MDLNSLWSSGVIGAIIGAFIGAFAAFAGNFYLQNSKEKKEINALRKLLKNEIQNNMEMIESIYNSVISNDFKGNDHEINYLRGIELSKIEVIQLKQDFWNTKTLLYAIAFSGSEMTDIDVLYLLFSKTKYFHSQIRLLSNQFYRQNNTPEETVMIGVDIEKMWVEFNHDVSLCLQIGKHVILDLDNSKK